MRTGRDIFKQRSAGDEITTSCSLFILKKNEVYTNIEQRVI